jgi:hypothetical protein
MDHGSIISAETIGGMQHSSNQGQSTYRTPKQNNVALLMR